MIFFLLKFLIDTYDLKLIFICTCCSIKRFYIKFIYLKPRLELTIYLKVIDLHSRNIGCALLDAMDTNSRRDKRKLQCKDYRATNVRYLRCDCWNNETIAERHRCYNSYYILLLHMKCEYCRIGLYSVRAGSYFGHVTSQWPISELPKSHTPFLYIFTWNLQLRRNGNSPI